MAGEVYVNFEEGVKRVVNNTGLYVRLLAKFKNDFSLDDLNVQLAGGDLEKAQATVHAIKGAAANLSLTELNARIVELESQIKARAVAPGQFAGVQAAFDATMKEIDRITAKYA